MDTSELNTALGESPSDRRLTPEYIESCIKKEEYLVVADTCLTICVLTLQNGFSVSAQAACADPANYNPEIGEAVSRRNAVNQIWPLEGYLLKQSIWVEDRLAGKG